MLKIFFEIIFKETCCSTAHIIYPGNFFHQSFDCYRLSLSSPRGQGPGFTFESKFLNQNFCVASTIQYSSTRI